MNPNRVTIAMDPEQALMNLLAQNRIDAGQAILNTSRLTQVNRAPPIRQTLNPTRRPRASVNPNRPLAIRDLPIVPAAAPAILENVQARPGNAAAAPENPATVPENASAAPGNAAAAPENLDALPDDHCCPICLEPWGSTGDHRLCSFPCGHLFGRKCADIWVKRSRPAVCPICKMRVTPKGIRDLFATKVVTMDRVEVDEIVADLEKERAENRKLRAQMATFKNNLKTALLTLEPNGNGNNTVAAPVAMPGSGIGN